MFNYLKVKGHHLFLKMATKETSMFDAGLLFIMFGSALVGFSETYVKEFGLLLTLLFQMAFIVGCVGFASFSHEMEKNIRSHEGFEDFKYAANLPFSEFKEIWDEESFKE